MTTSTTLPTTVPGLRKPPGSETAGERVIVGIGDMQLGQGDGQLILTFALGSCVGLTLWDPLTKVGAMLHAMLPSGRLAAEKALSNPFMFVDTGVPETFRACYERGVEKSRLICHAAGGASTHSGAVADVFQIGLKNLKILETILEKNNVPLRGRDVGGRNARTLLLDLASGAVTVQSGREEKSL